MRKMLFAFAVALTLILSTAKTGLARDFDASSLSDSGLLAYQNLLCANLFAVGPIGYGATISEGELDLLTLLKEKEAKGALESLIGKASPEGSLYGLIGLRSVSAESFQREVEHYKVRPEVPERKPSRPYQFLKIPAGHVLTMSGCLIGTEKIETLLRAIETGNFDGRLDLSFDERRQP